MPVISAIYRSALGVDIPAGFVESYRVLEEKWRRLAYFHDEAYLYLLGLPPGGFENLRGKDQIQPMFEENIASHFKMEVECSTSLKM